MTDNLEEQPNALQLADTLERENGRGVGGAVFQAPAELRRQHAEIQQLKAKLKTVVAGVAMAERKACLALVERHFREFRDIAGEDLVRVIWNERGQARSAL